MVFSGPVGGSLAWIFCTGSVKFRKLAIMLIFFFFLLSYGAVELIVIGFPVLG